MNAGTLQTSPLPTSHFLLAPHSLLTGPAGALQPQALKPSWHCCDISLCSYACLQDQLAEEQERSKRLATDLAHRDTELASLRRQVCVAPI